jgi:deazaflavin-dependent oxidoreductase (nitroreductase family)
MAPGKGGVLEVRSRLHRAIFSATNGRLLHSWGGLPVVMLTTTGRRTGLARRTILVAPLQERAAIVVVASNGGSPVHPDWYLNLQRNSAVVVATRGGRQHMSARTATPVEARRLWPEVTKRSPGYARYQQRTKRTIPLVILEPMA